MRGRCAAGAEGRRAVTAAKRVTDGDLYSTKPGTLAGTYLRRFWQPVACGDEVAPGRAVPRRIMSEDVTVYRGDDGRPHVVQGHCPHRATQLSTGWVEGDAIRCRYHGWKFDEHGACVEQPGEDASFAAKVCLRTYPAHEYLGLIFAYLGEGEPPPLKRFSDFERDGFVGNGPPEYWPCNYFNRIDNATDVGHLPWTHRESITRTGVVWRLETPVVTAEETAYGIRSSEKRPGHALLYSHFHMPNINQVRSTSRVEGSSQDAARLWVDRLFWRVPVDDERCVSYVIDYLPLFGEEKTAYAERRRAAGGVGAAEANAAGESVLSGAHRIEDVDIPAYKMFWIEDYAVQVGQEPISDERDEHLGRMDVGVILLRKLWRRELQALFDGQPLKEWLTPAGLAEMSEEEPVALGSRPR
jgi:5,5'-dehydrodivanillate O-demethylase